MFDGGILTFIANAKTGEEGQLERRFHASVVDTARPRWPDTISHTT